MRPVALTIAGSDPSGGAGLQADLKTFQRFGVYGCAVPTLITVQDTRAVARVHPLHGDLAAQQLAAVLSDLPVRAVKTGALGDAAVVRAVADALRGHELALVVDPVQRSTSGAVLLDDAARRALLGELLPLAALVTPNLAEAGWLWGREVASLEQAQDAARAIADQGGCAVLVKGGHLDGDPVDTLCVDGCIERLRVPRVETPGRHGLGCALSAAIAAQLAHGRELGDACARAQQWVARALASAPPLGAGRGPIDFFA